MAIALLLIALISGVLTLGILLAQRKHRSANQWLSALVVVFMGSLTHNLLLEAGVYERNQWLYFIPINGQLLIGPLLWFYVLRMLDHRLPAWWGRLAHMAPGLIQLAVHGAAFFLNDADKYQFWIGTYEPWLKPFFFWGSQLGLIIYLLLSHRTLERWRDITEAQFSDTRPVAMQWLHRLILLFAVFAAVAITLGLVPDAFHSTGIILPTDVLKLLIVCAIGWQGYRQVEVVRITQPTEASSSPLATSGHPADVPSPPAPTPVEVMELPGEPASVKFDPLLLQQIVETMKDQALFRQPDLTLMDLALAVKLPAKVVSTTINSGTGSTFLRWVNSYRVEAVKAAIAAGEHRSKSLLGIALDAGFSAKSTFNRAFREHEGCSPSEWVERSAQGGSSSSGPES
ncbi:MAG: helix-turn-helix domain-containing protein [Flavobacteriales bacterium]|nr:helix-turn-helix domain-containing protein [Flavobacteriales bacterium]